MGFATEQIGKDDARPGAAARRRQRRIARICAGLLLLIGVLCTAPAVAASGTSTAPSAPTATEPAAPPTTAPPSGANGLLSSGPAGTTAPTLQPTAAADPTATAGLPAVPSALQSVPVTPTGAAAGDGNAAPSLTNSAIADRHRDTAGNVADADDRSDADESANRHTDRHTDRHAGCGHDPSEPCERGDPR